MKRKYTRKVSPDNVQSNSSLSKEESSINLPPDILNSVEKIVEHRKNLGLLDDREERTERAIRYQEFIRGRR